MLRAKAPMATQAYSGTHVPVGREYAATSNVHAQGLHTAFATLRPQSFSVRSEHKRKHQRIVLQMYPRAHLSERGLRSRNVQSKAAYQTDAQAASSDTRTKGSNGWAWVLGGLTLTAGTSAPALYIGSHWNEVRFSADDFTHFGPGCFISLLAITNKRLSHRSLRWPRLNAQLG